MHELHRITNGREIGHGVDELIERGVASPRQQQSDEGGAAPEPDHAPLLKAERAPLCHERVREAPQRYEEHEDSGVLSSARMARKRSWMGFCPIRIFVTFQP